MSHLKIMQKNGIFNEEVSEKHSSKNIPEIVKHGATQGNMWTPQIRNSVSNVNDGGISPKSQVSPPSTR